MPKIGLNQLIVKNIIKKPLRSGGLVLLVTLFSFSLLAGALMSSGLSRGVNTISNRLGADVMAVPAGHEAKIDSVLLRGSASPFYLPSGALDKLRGLESAAALTPQLYLAQGVQQVIGIDPATDFLVSAWLGEKLTAPLSDANCIVGNRVASDVGQTIELFGRPYRIAARLQATGMSFDDTVFIDIQAARQMVPATADAAAEDSADDLTSTVLIKLKGGYQSLEVARQINRQFASQGIFGMFSKKFVNNLSSNLSFVVGFVHAAIGLIWLLTVAVLSLAFTMILRDRQKELATLRILGVSQTQLKGVIVKESALISAAGGAIGLVFGYVAVVYFGISLGAKLRIPFILPGLGEMIGWGVAAGLSSLLIAPLASFYALTKMMRRDVYQQFRDRE